MKIPDCTHCLLFNDGPLLSVGACGLCDMDYRPIVIMMIEESSMKSLKIVEKDFWFYGLIKESQPYINKGGSLIDSEPPFIMNHYVQPVDVYRM